MTSFVDFPYQIGPRGATATTDYADHVRDMIEQLLFTRPGERRNRPDFGCGLLDRVFEPNGVELAAVLQVSVEAALQLWLGDLIAVDSLTVTADDSSLLVEVRYELTGTGEPQIAVIDGSAFR
jgi:phage baseplate assembly protein W